MKLTVGPLPPAVYWRRRAAVAGTLLLVVIALLYSCGGNSNVAQRDRAQSPAGRTSPTPTPSASASVPVFTPGGGIDIPTGGGGDTASPSASPSLVPAAQPAPVPSGPCTDGEISVVATPAQPSVQYGHVFVRFYLRIKNISSRSCTRDVGADPQELYLQDASKTKVWSSDACNPRPGNDVRMFHPGDQAEFFLDWTGNATNNGCGDAKVSPGKYQLFGRLATKLSDPAPLDVVK